MYKILYLAICCVSFTVAGQTTHSVPVRINQPSGCPVPLGGDLEEASFRLYPNPAEKTITVHSGFSHYEVRIYSLQGELVHRAYSEQKKGEVDVQNLAEGIYLLEMHSPYHSESRRIKIRR